MTDDDHGEEQDPLLVRPYLRHDTDAQAGDPAAPTWPSATREARSPRALEGTDDPTAIVPAVPAEPSRLVPRRVPRRILVLIAACAALLLGAGAAGFAALNAADSPAVNAMPEAPVPALSGLVPPSPTPASSPATTAAASPTHKHRSSPAETSATATTSAAPASPSTAASTGATPGKTGSASAGLAPKPATARTGTIRGQNGLCLDLNGGVPVAFNHIQVVTCNGTAAQSWTLATDGTLRVQGMCALILGDDTVHIVACDTRTTAQWRADGQLLVNAANDECLTDPSAGKQSGTAVRVTACSGGAGQRWSLP